VDTRLKSTWKLLKRDEGRISINLLLHNVDQQKTKLVCVIGSLSLNKQKQKWFRNRNHSWKSLMTSHNLLIPYIQGGSQKLLLTTKNSIVSSSIFSAPPCMYVCLNTTWSTLIPKTEDWSETQTHDFSFTSARFYYLSYSVHVGSSVGFWNF